MVCPLDLKEICIYQCIHTLWSALLILRRMNARWSIFLILKKDAYINVHRLCGLPSSYRRMHISMYIDFMVCPPHLTEVCIYQCTYTLWSALLILQKDAYINVHRLCGLSSWSYRRMHISMYINFVVCPPHLTEVCIYQCTQTLWSALLILQKDASINVHRLCGLPSSYRRMHISMYTY